MPETLRLEGDGPLLHLVLNRPALHNAINQPMLEDLLEACLEIERREARVVILRGEGPSFSSGADLKEGLTHGGGTAAILGRSQLGARVVRALGDLSAITLAEVHGHAIGGGACLAMACDFRIAAQGARVSIREGSLGLSLSWQSIPNLVHLVGPTRAKQMILFGQTFDAVTLREWGFFQEVVPEAGLRAAAMGWAEEVLHQPPLPVALTKRSVRALTHALDQAIFHADAASLALTAQTRDAARARDVFFKGEVPEWEGE